MGEGLDMMRRQLDCRPVTMEEQGDLIRRAKAGDRRAYERLFGSVFLYICREAKRYSRWRHDLEPEDLVTHGAFAVMRAIEKFDTRREIKFLTYAGWWIRQFIRRYVQGEGVVKQPAYRYGEDHVEDAKRVDDMVWIDAKSGEDGAALGEVAALNLGLIDETFADRVGDRSLVVRVLCASAMLVPRERFAFESTVTGDMTLEEAGAYLDLTRERIRQLRIAAIDQVRWILVCADKGELRLRPLWVPETLECCLTPGCGDSSLRFKGGGAMRCESCFLDFAEEARMT